jgi:arginine/ornithine transport system permease protein
VSVVDAIRAFSASSSPVGFWLILQNWRLFWTGLQNTMILLVISLIAGGVIAVPLAIVRATRVPVLNPLAYAFIYLIRGTPLLVQLYIIYYGFAQFDAVRHSAAWVVLQDPWWCALIAFSISTSAYTAEIFRAAIVDTPRGEVESAIAVGMSRRLAMRRIILPSAFRRALPAYGNEVIFNLQSTSLASTVTVIDVLGAARLLNNKYYLASEGFLAAAVIYIAVILIITSLFRSLERRLFRHLSQT